jgi:hypothetical protein
VDHQYLYFEYFVPTIGITYMKQYIPLKMTLAQGSLPIQGDNGCQGHEGRLNRVLVLGAMEGRGEDSEPEGSSGGGPAQPVSPALLTGDYRPCGELSTAKCGARQRGVEDGASSIDDLARELLGLKSIFFSGLGRCLRKYGPRTAVSSMGQGRFLTRQASS